ncbi:homeobox protein Nkx-2.2a [Nematostella vectensis]|nr:homeobox protein Nkx-2.2a [Nematostella vectensis]
MELQSRAHECTHIPIARKPTSFMIADLLNLREADTLVSTCAGTHEQSKDATCHLQQAESAIRTCAETPDSVQDSQHKCAEQRGKYFSGSTGIPDNEAQSSKARNKRPVFHPDVVAQLEQVFEERRYISADQRFALAKELNMTEEQVKSWFHNKRTAMTKKLAEAGQRAAKLAYLQTLASKLLPAESPQDAMPQGRLHSYDITSVRSKKYPKSSRSYKDNISTAHLRKANEAAHSYGSYPSIPHLVYRWSEPPLTSAPGYMHLGLPAPGILSSSSLALQKVPFGCLRSLNHFRR